MDIHERNSMIYLDALRMETELSYLILAARVELVGMEMEIETYRRSNGDNESYKFAKNRFKKIWDAVKYAARVDDEAFMYRLHSENLARDNEHLKKRVGVLEHQLKSINEAWNTQL